jgi:predicted ABC-type ATPase
MNQPVAIVLGGINGAGKTTVAQSLLAEQLAVMTFLNADTLAQGMSAFAPETANIAAGRAMLIRLRELAEDRTDLAWESTLSGKSYLGLIKELKADGYRIEIYYFWLQSIELEIERVALRVLRGGHNIPQETLRRRFRRSFNNFWHHYRLLADSWFVYDNSMSEPCLTAAGSGLQIDTIGDPVAWKQFQEVSSRE